MADGSIFIKGGQGQPAWFRQAPPNPPYVGSSPTEALPDELESVTISDITYPDIDGLSVNDVVNYESTTTEGSVVTIDVRGHIAVDAQPIAGESFDYNINGGAMQTYTWT